MNNKTSNGLKIIKKHDDRCLNIESEGFLQMIVKANGHDIHLVFEKGNLRVVNFTNGKVFVKTNCEVTVVTFEGDIENKVKAIIGAEKKEVA